MSVRVQRDDVVPARPADLAALFADVPALIACIPGAAVTGRRDDGSYDAEVGAQYGDLAAMFRGTLEVETLPGGTFVGRVRGRDAMTGTGASGTVTVAIAELPAGTALRTVVDLEFSGIMAPLAGAAARYTVPLLLEAFAGAASREAARRVTAP